MAATAELNLTWDPMGNSHKNLLHPPFFLICIIGQNRQKFKVHKKSRNICLKAHHYALTVQIWAHSGLSVRHFRTSTNMATTAELNLTWDPMGNSHKNLLFWNHLLNKNKILMK
jgi:hypothetical protein